MFANPTLDANGEDLFPGDVLCEQDLGSAVGAVDSGNIDGATVTAIAQHLGLKTLAIQVGQDVVMADSEGKVSVSGESGQHISSEQIASLQANVSGGASELPASVNGNASLSGAQQSKGSYTVNGNLNLASGVLVIHGDLTVTGTITGSGAVFATGNITAAGANLTSDDRYGLVAGGSLNLP
ncbi:MAG: hypothetical protein JO156_00465 [Solirubrobacterales bacterium]|nr:hypothetical protein [Solirubrobacterales bacterium]